MADRGDMTYINCPACGGYIMKCKAIGEYEIPCRKCNKIIMVLVDENRVTFSVDRRHRGDKSSKMKVC